MRKIDLMIVGAQKAATTSLKNYLGEHPEITTHPQIEFDFFVRDEAYEAGYEAAFRKHFGDPSKIGREQRIIAKNANMYTHPKAIERLKDHNPDCKVVFLVRNPVDRAYSSYSMQLLYNDRQPFSDIVDVVNAGDTDHFMYRQFARLGLYSEFARTMYEYFPDHSVFVRLFEDLKRDPGVLCRELFTALGVDSDFTPDLDTKHNQTRKVRSKAIGGVIKKLRRPNSPVKRLARFLLPPRLFGKIAVGLTEFNKSAEKAPPLDRSTRISLAEFFEPYNEELERLTGLDTSVWRPADETEDQKKL